MGVDDSCYAGAVPDETTKLSSTETDVYGCDSDDIESQKKQGGMMIELPGVKDGTSWLMAVFAIVTTIVGAGVVNLPKGFADAGLIVALVGLALVTWVSWECGLRMKDVVNMAYRLKVKTGVDDVDVGKLEDIVGLAFGQHAKLAVCFTFHFFMITIGAVFLVLMSMEILRILPALIGSNLAIEQNTLIVVFAILLNFICWQRDMSFLAKIASAGWISCFIVVLGVFVVSAKEMYDQGGVSATVTSMPPPAAAEYEYLIFSFNPAHSFGDIQQKEAKKNQAKNQPSLGSVEILADVNKADAASPSTTYYRIASKVRTFANGNENSIASELSAEPVFTWERNQPVHKLCEAGQINFLEWEKATKEAWETAYKQGFQNDATQTAAWDNNKPKLVTSAKFASEHVPGRKKDESEAQKKERLDREMWARRMDARTTVGKNTWAPDAKTDDLFPNPADVEILDLMFLGTRKEFGIVALTKSAGKGRVLAWPLKGNAAVDDETIAVSTDVKVQKFMEKLNENGKYELRPQSERTMETLNTFINNSANGLDQIIDTTAGLIKTVNQESRVPGAGDQGEQDAMWIVKTLKASSSGFISEAKNFVKKTLDCTTMFLFAFIFVCTLPGVHVSMEQPKQCGSAISTSVFFVCGVYLLVGGLAYLAYGNDINNTVFEKMTKGKDDQGVEQVDASGTPLSGWICILCVIFIVANVFVSYALIVFSTLQATEEWWTGKTGNDVPGLQSKIIRTVMIAITAVYAITAPSFMDFCTLAVGIFGVFYQVVLPLGLYVTLSKQMKKKVPTMKMMIFGFFVAYGIILSVVAVSGFGRELIESITRPNEWFDDHYFKDTQSKFTWTHKRFGTTGAA